MLKLLVNSLSACNFLGAIFWGLPINYVTHLVALRNLKDSHNEKLCIVVGLRTRNPLHDTQFVDEALLLFWYIFYRIRDGNYWIFVHNLG